MDSHDILKEMGRLTAQVERLQEDVRQINESVSRQNEQLAKWRGAGAILTLIGGGIGLFGGLLLDRLWP